jgi:hypothetical protein
VSVALLVAADKELGEGGERKKPLGLPKSKKQWSDQWHDEAKRMRRRKEQ